MRGDSAGDVEVRHARLDDDALAALDFYLAHREQRLDQVRGALAALAGDRAGDPAGLARAVVERVYADVDPALWGAAELSVRAQIEYLRGGA